MSAETDGADWCVAGNVFETESHPDLPARDPLFVSRIVARVSIPVIAIGGVKPPDVPRLLREGAYGIASIRGIWEAKNSEAEATRYLSAYDGCAGEHASRSEEHTSELQSHLNLVCR